MKFNETLFEGLAICIDVSEALHCRCVWSTTCVDVCVWSTTHVDVCEALYRCGWSTTCVDVWSTTCIDVGEALHV